MKYFIVQGEIEYTIYKVSDDLIEDFKVKMEKSIVVEGRNIQDAIIKFGELEKLDDLPFNPALNKVKEEIAIRVGEEDDARRCTKLKVR
jgi:hypothetical protein